MTAIKQHHFTTTDDQGTEGLVIVDECGGLVEVPDEILRGLMVKTGIRNLTAGRSPDVPGVTYLQYVDMARLLTAAGMREAA